MEPQNKKREPQWLALPSQQTVYFLAGADSLEGVPESTEPVLLPLRDMATVRAMDVTMKMIADHVVRRVRTLEAPRSPERRL